MHPLVSEAMKKAAVAWLTVGERPPYAVWCLWQDDGLLVVSGPGEQPAPGLDRTSTATVAARGDHGGRIVSWRAAVTRIRPDSLDWDAAAGALAGKRLNSMPAAELTAHWAQACAISRLTPLEEPPMDLPAVSLAAPPVPTPATRKARKPFKLHKVRQPRDPGQRS